MQMKARVNLLALLVMVTLLVTLAGIPGGVQAQGGGNLLVNGDFEMGGAGEAWPFQDGIPEVQIAPGWRAFYVDNPPSKARFPVSCGVDYAHCSYWRRPEFRGTSTNEFANRIHGGALSQKYFSYSGQHEAGLYQQVGNLKPGTRLRFTVFMQTWSCLPRQDKWSECPTGDKSNHPAPMHTKVGIDPTGGTDPWSGNIVWSSEMDAYDVWTQFAVEAVAQNSTVTVFTYSWADWADGDFRLNNDVYIDDAVLIPVGKGSVPAAPAGTRASGTPVPSQRATPDASGKTMHVVQKGESLSRIARLYGVSVKDLQSTNSITDVNRIKVGQQLVIPAGAAAPAASRTPAPANRTTPTPAPGGKTTPTPTPRSTTAAPRPGGSVTHTVQKGETLSAIAKKYGVTVAQIQASNNITDVNRIEVGIKLVIPAPAPTPTPKP